MEGGETYIKKTPSIKVTDIARAIAPDARHQIVGIRPGEKLHEELISETDSLNSAEGKKFYVILNFMDNSQFLKYLKIKKLKKVKRGFKYSSDNNVSFLNSSKIKEILKLNNLI